MGLSVVGLVVITPGAGFVSPLAALLIGVCGAFVSFAMIQLRNRLNFDDSLDVFACHGMAGLTGTLLLGVFSLKSVNAAGADGLIAGNASLLGVQILGVIVAAGFAFVATMIILRVLQAVMGLRPSSADEEAGLDLSDHGETGYHGGEYGVSGAASSIGANVIMSPSGRT